MVNHVITTALPYGHCERCEKPLIRRRLPSGQLDGHHRRFCSKACAIRTSNERRQGPVTRRQAALVKSRERHLRHAETWDGITDEEIYERDGWKCKLCRRKISQSVKYPHKRSKSIDHIIPISRGGGDIAANKRAAHLGCNMRRRNEIKDDQLLLFGADREPPLTPELRGTGRQEPTPCQCGKRLGHGGHCTKMSFAARRQRAQQAIALREAGEAWATIDELLGYSRGGAFGSAKHYRLSAAS